MKKVFLIIAMLLLCGMPLCFGIAHAESDEGPSDPPPWKSEPVEVVMVQIFNSSTTLVYQGMAYIISEKLVVNTAGWEKGTYTAYATAEGVPDRVFTIVCE